MPLVIIKSDRRAREKPCLRCGYSLRRIDSTHCPECGLSVWLSLNQLAQLFQRDKSVISRHIKNVFEEGELRPEGTVAKSATVQNEGGKQVSREIEFFNLAVRHYSEGRTEVESFSPIDIISLSPRDEFFGSVSWKTSA